jgi:hypothetical protein
VKMPSIGDVLEEHGANGKLWRVVGTGLMDGVEEDKPERKTLYIDVEPVMKRPEIPEVIRRGLEE